jgi:hypothetical protein
VAIFAIHLACGGNHCCKLQFTKIYGNAQARLPPFQQLTPLAVPHLRRQTLELATINVRCGNWRMT